MNIRRSQAPESSMNGIVIDNGTEQHPMKNPLFSQLVKC